MSFLSRSHVTGLLSTDRLLSATVGPVRADTVGENLWTPMAFKFHPKGQNDRGAIA
ncbi:MAG: hypothetical protein ACP5D7_18835 [Limnospira sp.]